VAQLYIHDPVASLSQPVRRLRGFQRVTLAPGQTTTVSWRLDRNDVGFYDNHERFRVENGTIEVYAGDRSSESDNKQTFRIVGGRRPRRQLERGRRRLVALDRPVRHPVVGGEPAVAAAQLDRERDSDPAAGRQRHGVCGRLLDLREQVVAQVGERGRVGGG